MTIWIYNVIYLSSVSAQKNVGIGTTAPAAKLEVSAPALGGNLNDVVEMQRIYGDNGNASFLDVRHIRTSAGVSWLSAGTRIQQRIDVTWMGYTQFNGNSNDGGISFGTGQTTTAPGNVTEQMRITSAGNVGIGTTIATNLLALKNNSFIAWRNNANTNETVGISSSTADDLQFYNSGTRMTILSSGNVGIGTTSPTQNLQVAGLWNAAQIRTHSPINNGTTNDIAGVSFTTAGDANNWIVYRYGSSSTNRFCIGINGVNEPISITTAGNVTFSGTIAKAGGSFLIDHPTDPENKYLYHSFVESPDMMNIYNGIVTLDERGEATVELPGYFDALNKDFRYQLTAIGQPSPGVYIASKIENGRFKISGGTPRAEISWQVTGIRKDKYAEMNRIVPEVEKEQENKGKYLHPEAWHQPKENGIYFNQYFKGRTKK